jgi:hypothetical protein
MQTSGLRRSGGQCADYACSTTETSESSLGEEVQEDLSRSLTKQAEALVDV